MKKTLNFKCTDEEYIVENTNPNEKKEPFKIDKKTMKFRTMDFYEYVFADIDKDMEIEVVNLISNPDKADKRTYSTVDEICQGVISKMREKCFLEE